MFNNLSLPLKILVLAVVYSLAAIAEYYIFNAASELDHFILVMMSTFMECWVLILFGFTFFQTFKTFRFPDRFYKRKKFETDKYFKSIGMDVFHYLLTHSFFQYLNRRVYIKGNKREYFKVFYEETKQAETSHFFSLIPTTAIQIMYLINGEYLVLFWLCYWSLFFNIYPILLQRKNRFYLEDKFPNLVGSFK